jgi:hypothetical protein
VELFCRLIVNPIMFDSLSVNMMTLGLEYSGCADLPPCPRVRHPMMATSTIPFPCLRPSWDSLAIILSRLWLLVAVNGQFLRDS